jgi:hypothetical protein
MQHETSIKHGLNQFIIAAAKTNSKLATDNMLGLAVFKLHSLAQTSNTNHD